jgi:uncharacterized protein (DUF2062 family)
MGWAIAIATFWGLSPIVGLRPWIAIVHATVARKNKLLVYLATHLSSNMLLAPFVAIAEIQLAHRLRRGSFLPLTLADVQSQGASLLGDWIVGWLVMAPPLTAVAGIVTTILMRRREYRRDAPPLPPPLEHRE